MDNLRRNGGRCHRADARFAREKVPIPPPENTRDEAGIVQETLSDLRKSPGVGMMLPIVREVS